MRACMIILLFYHTHHVGKKILIIVYRAEEISVVFNHAITLYFWMSKLFDMPFECRAKLFLT